MKKNINFNELKTLLPDSLKITIDNAVDEVIKNPDLYPQMLVIAFTGEKKFAQRASRVVYYAGVKQPELALPLYGTIISNLQNIENESIKGTLTALFTEIPLPENEELLGILTNFCFEAMNTVTEKAAMKVYPMQVLYRITKIYPELKNELALILRNQIEFEKPGYQAAAVRILKKIG